MVLVELQSAVSGALLGRCDADTVLELKAWAVAQLKIPVPQPTHN